MEQKFTREKDNKIRWDYIKDVKDFDDKDFGSVGIHGGNKFIIFDDKEKAMSILDRDITEVNANIDKYKQEMEINIHNLDKFPEIKELVESIGKLHNDFKDIKNIPEKLYADNPKKYQKLLRDFNNAKEYIVSEMSAFNKEYQKYLNYIPAEKAYNFNKEELDKIEEQKKQLKKL